MIRDGQRVSFQTKQMWQDFIRALIPPGITPFFFSTARKSRKSPPTITRSALEEFAGSGAGHRIHQPPDRRPPLHQEPGTSGTRRYLRCRSGIQTERTKKERGKLERRKKERTEAQEDLDAFRQQYDEAKKRFQATFHTEPEARETMRENEKTHPGIQPSRPGGQ